MIVNKKRFLLLLLVVCCFFACFYYLNKKYDRFYRIAGIDNEKRQMILTYLTEKEQDYLVEHSIDSDRFMKYIELDDFAIQNISYYEIIEEKNRPFLSDAHLLKYTNELIAKIKTKTTKNLKKYFKDLVKTDLDEIFIQSETYNLDLTGFYNAYKADKPMIKPGDIDLLNSIEKQLTILNYSSSDQKEFIKKWESEYSLDSIYRFLEEKLSYEALELVEHPSSLTAIINDNFTISSYVPSPLTIPYEVSRTSFAMYLRQDAAVSLEELYKACSKAIKDETLLLVGAYQSYESLLSKYTNAESTIVPGQNEFQLALTVDLSVLNTNYNNFNTTKICQYLKENAWKYGFIQRSTTEDHIYRYVGKSAAEFINEKNLTLEEYEGVMDE